MACCLHANVSANIPHTVGGRLPTLMSLRAIIMEVMASGGTDVPAVRIDKELIQQDSPFLGTRRFGMCFTSQGGMAKVGTLLEVQQHLPLEDGRMLITNKGIERFQILRVVQEKPVLLCEVEILKDQPGEDEKLVGFITHL